MSNLNFHQIEISTYLPKDRFFIIIHLYNSKINYAVWGGSLWKRHRGWFLGNYLINVTSAIQINTRESLEREAESSTALICWINSVPLQSLIFIIWHQSQLYQFFKCPPLLSTLEIFSWAGCFFHWPSLSCIIIPHLNGTLIFLLITCNEYFGVDRSTSRHNNKENY